MSSETYSPSSFETESEMLPQDPPPKIIRFMGWWLIWLFIIALLAGIFVHLPETEHAAFVLVPRDGADPIQSPRLATVNRVSLPKGKRLQPARNYLSCDRTRFGRSICSCKP